MKSDLGVGEQQNCKIGLLLDLCRYQKVQTCICLVICEIPFENFEHFVKIKTILMLAIQNEFQI